MVSKIKEQLETIDGDVLTPPVQQALDRKDVRVADWRSQPIYGGVELGSSLYRFSGGARAASAVIPWTLILKVVQAPPGGSGDPQGVKYWKREPLAYQSGLLSDLPGGLVAPHCYKAIERPGGAYWVWMQDIQDDVGDTWPLEHYGMVARCLGQFNGAYLMGRPLPTHPWLTRKWLRRYVEQAAPAVALLLDSMDHPLIRRALPGLSAEFIQRAWNERYAILETVERLPQTFCHLDAFRRNLFSRRTAEGGDQVVAVDWSYAGIASVGEDLAPLVGASIGFYAVMPADALRLEQIALDGYLAGLSDAGWQGNPDLVRFGYAATLYWRYVFGGFVGEMVPWMLDERYHAAIERATGHTMEEGADYTALLIEFYQHVYEQVHELKAVLD